MTVYTVHFRVQMDVTVEDVEASSREEAEKTAISEFEKDNHVIEHVDFSDFDLDEEVED